MATGGKQNVCDSSYVNDLRRKSRSVKVKDPLHERLLLDWPHLEINRSYLVSRADTLETALNCRTRDFIVLHSFTLAFHAS